MAQTNLVGQQIFGYDVTEKISSGAFGTVYKLEKVNQSGRYVRALKHITIPTERQYTSVLNSMGGDISKANNYFEKMLRDIVSEIQVLNHLSENGVGHIVRYFENDIIMSSNPRRYDVYILMEYLTPLEEYLRTNDFTVGDVLNLAEDVLVALRACHANGVWHRDIKDDNIFVAGNGDYKIGDFGVSKVLKDSSKAESLKGTPNFLAPEVYLGRSGYTETVDLYSLGIVLYRLLNYGRNPFLPKFPEQYFSEDEDMAFSRRMAGETPDFPAMGGDRIGQVIVKAIANSRDRYQTAEAFLRDLRAARQGTGRDILMRSVRVEATPRRPDPREIEQDLYDKTMSDAFWKTRSKTLGADHEKGSAVNRHLFDNIIEEPAAKSDPYDHRPVNSWDDGPAADGFSTENGGQKADKKQKRKFAMANVVLALCAGLATVFLLMKVFVFSPGRGTAEQSSSVKLKTAEVGDTVIFGSYEQDQDLSNGGEDVEWLVLARDNDRILVISRYGLDGQEYHLSSADVTWENCDLRAWLNGTFLNRAFTSEEQAMIAATSVRADANPEYHTNQGNDTVDKVFLLSISEVERYFASDAERQCAPTAYAEAQGAHTDNGQCWWWLRSPGYVQSYAADIFGDGSVNYYGDNVLCTYCAVRPAMWIDLTAG